MFRRWRRMQEEDCGRVWRLYGWYSALMTCGSCVGAVAWTATMMSRVNVFKANKASTRVERASLAVAVDSWQCVFLVTYAVEFLCLSAAKLMVLDRMSVFAAPQAEGSAAQKRWTAAGRVVMAGLGGELCERPRGDVFVYYMVRQRSCSWFCISGTKCSLL